jgi:hypothetical protein
MFAILVLSIEEPLCPIDATQDAEALWLNDERDVEPLHDRIYTERYIVNRPNRPNRHHCCKKTIDALSPVVAPYLGSYFSTVPRTIAATRMVLAVLFACTDA